ATGALRRMQQPEPDRPHNRFNDGKCDADGRFWAGTMDFDATAPTGALYRYTATAETGSADAGVGICERAFDAGFAVTNGPAWSKDGATMYFTDTVRREITAFDFDHVGGALSNRRTWLRLAGGDGNPDGMTTDAAGRIWIAHWGGACVSCHEPERGAELMRVALPTAHITNVAFGGRGLDTLYITSARSKLSADQLRDQPSAGGLFAVRTDAVGCAANLFAG
ncbi:MAG: SMP-30/gluconolactonase/LRE family protein, partial [Pseudomonadota bacterium]|nr:SMP-30/gluconolactonase/LRE family protein [Pseudomonadota bacterium]